ncbi:hypothetical protein FTX61_01510 [Nitriliruptoraceae bacterium ZYF776]|nr:hypothetical protein [Profundirhabdus halotolerans]
MRATFPRAALLALALSTVPAAASAEVELVPEVVDATVGVELGSAATAEDDPAVGRSTEVAAPIPFTMIGFELPDGVDAVEVRTATDDGDWSEWYELERIGPSEGPDPGTAEAEASRAASHTEVAWVGESTRFEVAVPAGASVTAADAVGSVVEATVLDTDGLSGGPVERQVGDVAAATSSAAPQPAIVSRAQWGAQAPRNDPSYAAGIDLTVVHHTAGSNDYTPEQAAGQVRGIQDYHRNTLGWSDIGYHVLVDRYGQLYEGRAGGLDQAVIGAHASGFNTGSFGISVMGNFEHVDAPQAAYDALYDAIAWKATIHGFDPLGTTPDRTYGGAPVRTVDGHRNVGQTVCPGLIQDRMWQIREQAAARMG